MTFVAERFGVGLHADAGEALDRLVELALRRNPKRAHLLVSTVLGKHVPTDPRIVHEAGLRLGRAVDDMLCEPPALVLGYAETATALGHCVAEALGAHYLHSTRQASSWVPPVGSFEEAHSHATGHLLVPEDPGLLARTGTIVLVDDEISTGRTALDTIRELQRIRPRDRYLLAALVDLRSSADRARVCADAARLGTTVDVVALASGSVSLPCDFPGRAADFAASRPAVSSVGARRAEMVRVPLRWRVRESGRHGFTPSDIARARAAAHDQAQVLAPAGPRVLVLGTEELMYAPLLLAIELAGRPGLDVRFSSTTRSPVLAVDEPGYPIRTVLAFRTDGGERYAYNIARGFDDIVLVTDTDDTAGLVAALREVCDRVHRLRLPRYAPGPLRGPSFGSYQPDEVGWLLTDLSDVALEAPVEEREEAVQSGGAHYAESLPIEYQPSAEYQALFDVALDESADRIAYAVGLMSELVLDARGPHTVLASLARAGTPIGILVRRWARLRHDLDLPHYAVSIVRGRGIDAAALRFLAAQHDPSTVQFVDGWTGKGAIVRELRSAIAATDPRFSPDLAVLADTGGCVRLYGTREDFLIPSACLNSTVSGLVSRTVRNDRVIAPGRLDGAKFYRDLAPCDVSRRFLDTVSSRFDSVADAVARDWRTLRDSDRTPIWQGWQEVERLSNAYGIGNPNLIKPGVGETTRVLLRRMPWRVLIRPDAVPELGHVLLLAEQRGVPVDEVQGLGYHCVGLIHPAYTRGATGPDGRAVR